MSGIKIVVSVHIILKINSSLRKKCQSIVNVEQNCVVNFSNSM